MVIRNCPDLTLIPTIPRRLASANAHGVLCTPGSKGGNRIPNVCASRCFNLWRVRIWARSTTEGNRDRGKPKYGHIELHGVGSAKHGSITGAAASELVGVAANTNAIKPITTKTRVLYFIAPPRTQ